MKIILLSKGAVAFIDDEDYDRVSKNKWSFANAGYAVRNDKGSLVYMHRFILNAPDGLTVDHKDGDRLNNTKSNLRVCTKKQNSRNCTKRSGDLTSKYKGVHWDSNRNKWKSEITVDYKNIYLGRFINESDAVNAYNKAAKKYFGVYSKINV